MSVSYGGDSITFADNSTITSGWTGFKNKIINGSMRIDQRNSGTAVNNASLNFGADRWRMYGNSTNKFIVQQVTSNTSASNYESGSVPTGYGFTHSTKITANGATSVGTSETYRFEQSIEGNNIADLDWGTANAKPVTLSFWIKSSLTGTFSIAAWNGGTGTIVSYVTTYSIIAANTWEYKTITIPGATTGLWDVGVNQGLVVQWSLGAGSSYSTSAMSSWPAPGNLYTAVTGQTTFVATNGATMYLTGVQVERGSTASSFEHRPYGTELHMCKRYCEVWRYDSTATTDRYHSGVGWTDQAIFKLEVEKRSTPSVTITGSTELRDGSNAAKPITSVNANKYAIQLGIANGTTLSNSLATIRMPSGATDAVIISAEI